MDNVVRVTLLMIFLTALSACSQQTEVSTLSTILPWLQIGGSQDYWLEERSLLSPDQWDKVALIAIGKIRCVDQAKRGRSKKLALFSFACGSLDQL